MALPFPMLTRVIYHDWCFDGAASAAQLGRFLQDSYYPDGAFALQGVLHTPHFQWNPEMFDPKVRVYMEINHNGPWTSGGKSSETEMIRLAGGENVFAEHDVGVTSNAEVVRCNPDIILSPIWLDAKVGGIDGITTLLEIMSRPGYDGTTAVKNARR